VATRPILPPGDASPPASAATEPVERAGGRGRKLPSLALLTSTIEGARLEPVAPPDDRERVLSLSLDALRLDHQPREIVPEEELQRLVASGEAHPPALLRRLEAIAAEEAYYAEILARLKDLSRSIAAEGVLQPIQVARAQDGYVVRDGHRRCLASLLAGKTTIPAVLVAEPSEVEAVARALIVNLQREDLTALEKGGALLRLALLVAAKVVEESATDEETLTLDALLGPAPDAESPPEGYSRALAARVREKVCAMVGLQPRSYYRLLALNRLDPRVRPLARGLTENHLRPIVGLPPDDQVELVAFAVKRGLSAREVTSLAGVVRSGDRDAVRRVMARLAREEGARERTAVSWEPLLHAVPKDVWRRCQSLRSELEALPPPQRRVRLDAMWEQDHLLGALRQEFAGIFAAYGYAGPSTPIAPDEE
jgi:ParB-like chromosome segregation protein Spo0J